MGLFSFLFGSKSKGPNQPEVTVTYVPPEDDEWERELKEQLRQREEGNRIKRQRLADLGVEVAMFTDYGVGTDANYFLRTFLPLYKQPDPATETVAIEFENLTSTGKVPKNVAVGRYSLERFDEYGTGEALSVHIKYLVDATPNMADIHIFKNRKSLHVSIRRRNGEFRITFAGSGDFDRDVRTMLYHEKEGKSQEDAMSSIAYELGKME